MGFSPVSNDELWSLLTEEITLDDIRKQRLAEQRCQLIDDAVAIFSANMQALHTRKLLLMRHGCPYGLRQQIVPESLRHEDYTGIAFTRALRATLATREHVPSGAESKAKRRRLAMANRGQGKSKDR
jgi:hypothetical protein